MSTTIPQDPTVAIPLIQAAHAVGVQIGIARSAAKHGKLTTGAAPTYDISIDALRTWVQANHPSQLSTITRAQFIARFSAPVKAAIVANPTYLVWWLELMDRPTINLADASVKAEVEALVTANILTAGDATTVLAWSGATS